MQGILDQLDIQADVESIENNGYISRYFLRLRPGGTLKKIEAHVNEIALGVRSYSIPLIKIIPERGLISLEMLVKEIDKVPFNDLVRDLSLSNNILPVLLGRKYSGETFITDITQMPHLLVAGTTGSGKSMLLHAIICSLMKQSQSEVELALIDPKNVEFASYKYIKQLRYPIANNIEDAYKILDGLIEEMDKRFRMMARIGVNSIQEYNKRKKILPYIVLVIDEFADLIYLSKKLFQERLGRLAQKSRACGIHIIIATQRPSADVVTGIVKANCPSVISFRVTSNINSRVVLDEGGAENLLGKGDGLINSAIYDMLRFKSAFLTNDEINKICYDNKKSLFVRIIENVRSR